jgi:hypothetical protein
MIPFLLGYALGGLSMVLFVRRLKSGGYATFEINQKFMDEFGRKK